MLPVDSHALYWHGHAASTTTTARKFVAFESDNTFAVVFKVDFVIDHIGCCNDVESTIVESLQSMLISSVAEEFSRGEAEEIATAVPLFAWAVIRIFIASTENRLNWNAEFVQGRNQIVLVLAIGL